MIPFVIIGAGMAGLACARGLAGAGLAPLVLDKGRGIGGRVATRRAGALHFDHGAQYVTARGGAFGVVLKELESAGALGAWQDGSGTLRTVGVPGMSALPKALSAGIEVWQKAQVRGLTREGGGWRIDLDGEALLAARVIVTVPAPQIAGLLGTADPLLAALTGVRMAPCLTLMAAVSAPAPFISLKAPGDPLSWIAQDSAKPGRPQGEGALWVAQAGEAFSEAHLEADPAELTALLLPLLCDRIGAAPDQVTYASAHRWRYARVTQPLGQPFLRNEDASLYLGGDWCLGARVEAAWDSGSAIAADLLARR